MKKKHNSSSRHQLSQPAVERLAMYALAATAAGVTVAATTPSAEAKVIFTPTNAKIAQNTAFPLDLNQDGVTDFKLISNWDYGRGTRCSLSVEPPSTENRIWGNQVINIVGARETKIGALALPSGVSIGPNNGADQHPGVKLMAQYFNVIGTGDGTYRTFFGDWANGGEGVKNRFLGLAFKIDGQTHFGWARLTVYTHYQCSGVLTGYAYETIPNKPIVTGDTGAADVSFSQPDHGSSPRLGSLGALALGFQSPSAWKRDEDNGIS